MLYYISNLYRGPAILRSIRDIHRVGDDNGTDAAETMKPFPRDDHVVLRALTVETGERKLFVLAVTAPGTLTTENRLTNRRMS